jgi:formylglycine-generating enzyme required for sulfatase activity
VDRYEASVWDDPACDGVTGTQFGQTADDYPPGTYPDNGNVTVALYACSVAGVPPSRFATWFQAQQACVASGKRLCSNEEWQAAAAGTRDPGAWPGASGTCTSTPPAVGRCNTCSTAPRNTGQAGSVAGGADDCVSAHGAEDMIGNVTEWVAWWGQVGLHWQTGDGQQGTWPADYGSDGTWNMDGRVGHVWPWTNGLPAAANRGGFWHYGTAEGTFDFNLSVGPGYRTDLSLFGFRCCRMR